MSRPPTPTALKILTGNPGEKKLPQREPKPRMSKRPPKPPIDMDPRAQAVWNRIAPVLTECRVLTEGDLLALECLCYQEVAWREAMKATLEHGLIQPRKNKDGDVVGFTESVYSNVAGKKMPELRAMYVQFGMTPASRSRIVAGEEEKNDWDEF